MFSAIELLGAVGGWVEVKMIAAVMVDVLQIGPLIACYGRLNQ